MNYSEKLKNPKWQRKRLEILKRDDFKCVYCNDRETELQIHHLKYTEQPWNAPNKDLITLCKHCHHAVSKDNNLKDIHSVIKNIYESDGVVSLTIKFKCDNGFKIGVYDISGGKCFNVFTFLEGGKFHQSVLKLTQNG